MVHVSAPVSSTRKMYKIDSDCYVLQLLFMNTKVHRSRGIANNMFLSPHNLLPHSRNSPGQNLMGIEEIDKLIWERRLYSKLQ